MKTLLIAILFAATMFAQGQGIHHPVMRYDTLEPGIDPHMGYDVQQWTYKVPVMLDDVRPPLICVGYLTLSPEDRAIGIRADMEHVYVSMSYGNYYLPYGGYIKDHARTSIGFIYDKYSIGMVYHSYGEVYEALPLNKASLKPISVELGARVFVTERFVAALRYDVLRREGTVDFGFCFGK